MAKLRVAYGPKNATIASIRRGEVPRGTLVLTRDSAEILFYDHEGNLRRYKEKYKFTSKEEAENWLLKNNCKGQIFSILEEEDFKAYIVDIHNKLKPLASGDIVDVESLQSDYLVDDPASPAFIKNKPTSFPMRMIDGLIDALASKVNIVNDIQPGVLMVANTEGNLECSGVSLDKLVNTLGRKVEIASEITPGALAVVSESGDLECSGIMVSDLLRASDVVLGSVTHSITVTKPEYIIPIPEEVINYTSLNIYHNGSLLVENIHYIVSGPNIVLRSYTTYEGDIITFIGHGATTNIHVSDIITIFRVNGEQLPVVDGVIDITIPTKPEDIGAASAFHSHEGYLLRESIFDDKGMILTSLLPRTDANIIEAIMLGDNILPVVDKLVVIPIATEESLGVVRSSNEINHVSVDVDGTMSIKRIDFSTIEQPEGQELVLVGGDSKSLLNS